MTGTIFNIFTVLAGGFIGLFFGIHVADNIRKSVMIALGLFTLLIGVQMFLETQNPILVLISLIAGTIFGELMKIEYALSNMGKWLEKRFSPSLSFPSDDNFVRGFLTASLLFCVGPMAILGSIQDGLLNDFNLLAIKSILDGFAALALASTLGVGVIFSVLVIFLYQGSITLLASSANAFLNTSMINEMSATGGVILVGLAISSLLEIKHIRAGNMLPALLMAPLIVYFITPLLELISSVLK